MISPLLVVLAQSLFAQTVRVAVPTQVSPGVVTAPVGFQAQTAVTPSLGGAALTNAALRPAPAAIRAALGTRVTAPATTAAGQTAPAASPIAAAAQESSATGLAAAAAKSPAAHERGGAGNARNDESRGAEKDPATERMFDGAGKAEPKDWTFMVFLNGHNNLDPFGKLNIKQMEKVGSNDRVNIVVQWASLGKPTKRMLIQRSESGEVTSPVIETLKPVDMGDANQLYEFIKWSAEKFPAQKYFVDIWDHGAGWHFRRRGGRPVQPMDVSWDDQTGNHITTEQVGQVMAKVKQLIGKPVDVLGFDACLMAMAEVAAEVKDSVRYFAGSEELEPGAGWPYDKVLQQWLASGPTDDGAALVRALTDQFVKAYSRAVTFSGLDMSKFSAFAAAAKALAAEIAGLDAQGQAAVKQAAKATERYGFPDYGDFLHFVQNLSKGTRVVSAPVLDAAARTLKELVIANGSSKDRPNANGVSVWLPMYDSLWRTHGKRYVALVWNALTGWGEVARRLSGGS